MNLISHFRSQSITTKIAQRQNDKDQPQQTKVVAITYPICTDHKRRTISAYSVRYQRSSGPVLANYTCRSKLRSIVSQPMIIEVIIEAIADIPDHTTLYARRRRFLSLLSFQKDQGLY